ncbi:hypothetical protein M8C13_25585 [Crossiella sp. SN42]|uniref:hypothetical protein n=1 Tax=Crossiella sp. SN42 TaxID=2944808 RepID=UPI00207CA3DD|nr:hypothetical protein [Crossiella sp. SN42]MCO1579127.1 hypothetical protein [Crossiella sp. SN42]
MLAQFDAVQRLQESGDAVGVAASAPLCSVVSSGCWLSKDPLSSMSRGGEGAAVAVGAA